MTLLGFLAGGIVGGGMALLFAPHSGSDTRQMIADNSLKLRDSAIESIQSVCDSAEAALKDAQARIDLVSQETKNYFTRVKEVGLHSGNGHKVDAKASI
jgi:gas vesicle protein